MTTRTQWVRNDADSHLNRSILQRLSFQHSPEGFPVLCGGFHRDFLALLFKQPVDKQAQLARAGAKPPSLKLVLAIDFDVGEDHVQHLLVNIDSCALLRHILPLAGAESVPRVT